MLPSGSEEDLTAPSPLLPSVTRSSLLIPPPPCFHGPGVPQSTAGEDREAEP